MAKQIIWLKSARDSYKSIVEYLHSQWSEKVAQDFIEKVDDKLELLKIFPQLGAESDKKKGVRKLVLSTHNTLIYRIKGEVIVLLSIYDSRRNPD
jgi:plasmid stabilization system protein ParE